MAQDRNDNTTKPPEGGTTTTGLPALIYKGEVIHERHEMLSLTDMWRAAGADEQKAPAKWRALPAAKAFAEHVAITIGKSDSDLFVTQNGGRNKGTWANWQVAMAYAKYLDHDFHMWCNTVVRERMEGHATTALPSDIADLIERTDGICRMMIGKVTGIEKSLPALAAAIAAEILPAMVSAAVASQTIAVRRGKTAGQIWRENGFPPIRISTWFGNRLAAMGCRIDGGGCGELGLTKARLYDPDKAQAYLVSGGRLLVERKIAERQGQGSLRLVTT